MLAEKDKKPPMFVVIEKQGNDGFEEVARLSRNMEGMSRRRRF